MSLLQDDDLLDQLGAFEAREQDDLLAVRRPAGADLIVEFAPRSGRGTEGGLAAFWLATLWRFLEDSRQNTDAFEGLAYQALAERLDAAQFSALYGPIRARLTLAPPHGVELREAYRVLQGRVTSFAGVTTDGEFWAGYHQANVYETIG